MVFLGRGAVSRVGRPYWGVDEDTSPILPLTWLLASKRAEVAGCLAEDILKRVVQAEAEAHGGQLVDDHVAELDQFQADGIAGRLRQLRAGQSQATKGLNQGVCKPGEKQPPLVGPPAMGAHPVGAEHHLFLHPILHFSASAVAPIVDLLGIADDVGDHEPGIAPFVRVRGLRDHPAYPAPGKRRIVEAREQALLFAGARKLSLGLAHQLRPGSEHALIASEADDVFHVVAVPPAEQQVATKAAVSAQDDLRARPLLPQSANEQLQYRSRVPRRVYVARAQVSTDVCN